MKKAFVFLGIITMIFTIEGTAHAGCVELQPNYDLKIICLDIPGFGNYDFTLTFQTDPDIHWKLDMSSIVTPSTNCDICSGENDEPPQWTAYIDKDGWCDDSPITWSVTVDDITKTVVKTSCGIDSTFQGWASTTAENKDISYNMSTQDNSLSMSGTFHSYHFQPGQYYIVTLEEDPASGLPAGIPSAKIYSYLLPPVVPKMGAAASISCAALQLNYSLMIKCLNIPGLGTYDFTLKFMNNPYIQYQLILNSFVQSVQCSACF